jgi:hypothetical protein
MLLLLLLVHMKRAATFTLLHLHAQKALSTEMQELVCSEKSVLYCLQRCLMSN